MRGVEAAFDAVGGTPGRDLASTLSPSGTMVHYGLLSGEPLPSGVKARHFCLRNWVNEVDAPLWKETLGNLFCDLKRWQIRLGDVRAYPISNFREAVDAAQQRGRDYKVLLVTARAEYLVNPKLSV